MNSVILRYLFILLTLTVTIDSIQGQSIVVEKLPVNSELKNDFAPYVMDSVLYYTSNRKHEFIRSYLDQNNEWLYRLYHAPIKGGDEMGAESLFRTNALSKLNTATISYSPDKNTVYITQNQYSSVARSKGRENLLGIFIIENKNGKWSRPVAFKHNSRRSYSNAHPTVTPDGKTMFFVSDRSDGFGETDIYQSRLVDGEWTEPENLGKVVNTIGKELFPFYHPSGKLYFSSNSHGSLGGFDIFYTSWDGEKWRSPVALEEPINSVHNDFSCFVNESVTGGYFASNRDGSDNIYSFSNPFPSFPDAKSQVDDNFCFTIYENGPFISDTLPYVYQWHFGDGQTAKGLEVDHCFPKPGLYNIHLNVVDTLANVDLYTVANYEINLEYTQQIYITAPDTVKVNELVNFSAEKSVLKDFETKQYYWNFGDSNMGKGVTISHNFRKKGIYIITCGAVSKDDPTNKMSSTREIVVTE
ncbi:PKD domain-containing protein [Labilibacter sediminis]|nr:PKD domain-containing protein [Labilibacter sediminis]